MIKKIKIAYQGTDPIDKEFEKRIVDFIQKEVGLQDYASGFNFQTGFRDIVFDKQESQ